ncbi:glycine--tRNA ligase [Candidatus Parcubacteria bacterium]|nr:MAG: glycine--tRNA ligase [Candidatus Parcubacteria bacterium]
MDKVISLCKRRGFIFPGSEIYGGLANSWDYGPLGVELKNNIKQMWWERFVHQRGDIVGIDAALIMNPKVWEASGHLKEFSDPLVECKVCHERFRADQKDIIVEHEEFHEKRKESAGWTEPKQFNLMFKTFIGPLQDEKSTAYFRPETAQAMFVNFKNVVDTTRQNLPFGIAQIGKAFRNEITTGNFIFRTKEFEQMEIEYFIEEKDWQNIFEMWRKEMLFWIKDLGVNLKKVHEREVPDGERAHYSKRTVDFDYEFPFGKEELYGLAYRTDFDLRNHEKASGVNLKYKDAKTGKEFWPHVIEPTWGVDRSLLIVLLEAYHEEGDRVVLKLPLRLAPYKVAVFPLLANKDKLVEKAKEIYKDLQKNFSVAWDDRGNIGKRYYSQDEIGTPWCITVDFESLENDTVTVRDRDTAKQERIKVAGLTTYFEDKLK